MTGQSNMCTYEIESRALDADIFSVIDAWHRHGEILDDRAFNDLALRLFDYQFRYNEPYARYCSRIGVTCPKSWEQIPAVPAAAFKEATVTTFDPRDAALVFETSGTTRGASGRHYLESAALYDAALLAAFDRFVLSDAAGLRFLNLVPNPAERPHSSLGYMMARVAKMRGNGQTGWYLRNDEMLIDAFEGSLHASIADGQAVCIVATAFALVHLLDVMEARAVTVRLPHGSRVVETGGFKGRTRVVDRDELYAGISNRFGIGLDAIVSEYGMTELTSQYYASAPAREHIAPPWLRARVVGPERRTLRNGEVGSLLHVDLANRSSCIAIQTEDIGRQGDAGLVLVGRDPDASLRGCSLDAEDLIS